MKWTRANARPYEFYFIVKRQKKLVDEQGEGANYQIPLFNSHINRFLSHLLELLSIIRENHPCELFDTAPKDSLQVIL